MVASAEVKLFGMWASPNVRRVEWALKMKGVKYEYIEEDLSNKSPSLLKYNPVNKQVPVLVHNGQSIIESLVILEYIDETWKDKPLLPKDPYERAMARFWATFAEVKCREATRKAFFGEGEERSKALKQLQENLQSLDEELKGKKFFGGDDIGFTDLVAGWLAFWLGISEEAACFKVVDAKKFPWFASWINNFLQVLLLHAGGILKNLHLKGQKTPHQTRIPSSDILVTLSFSSSQWLFKPQVIEATSAQSSSPFLPGFARSPSMRPRHLLLH